MNKRGQALIEFVLILPIFLFILLTIYDFGIIFNTKNKVSSYSNDIINMYNNGKSIDDIETIYDDLSITYSNENNYSKLEISDSVNLMTPIMKKIFGNPYEVKLERYVPNEE